MVNQYNIEDRYCLGTVVALNILVTVIMSKLYNTYYKRYFNDMPMSKSYLSEDMPM